MFSISGTQLATVGYYHSAPSGKENYEYDANSYIINSAADKLRQRDPHRVKIQDIRGREDDFSLDVNGFQLIEHAGKEPDWDSEDSIRTVVYPNAVEALKKATGATRVHVFSHINRRAKWQSGVEAAQKAKAEEVIKVNPPAMVMHIDQSYDGAEECFKDNLTPQDYDRLKNTRWGIINLWRPILIPVPREQLAVCDARSVSDSDLREIRAMLPKPSDAEDKENAQWAKVSKGTAFGLWHVAHNPSHKWYYASGMTPDEGLCIKCFDSKLDGRARRSPHSAFMVDGQDESAPARESCEIRCLVFWEDEETE